MLYTRSTKHSHSKIFENIVHQSDEYFLALHTLQRIAQRGIQLTSRIRKVACNSDEFYKSDDLRTVTKSLLEIAGEAYADTITTALQIHRIITKAMTVRIPYDQVIGRVEHFESSLRPRFTEIYPTKTK